MEQNKICEPKHASQRRNAKPVKHAKHGADARGRKASFPLLEA